MKGTRLRDLRWWHVAPTLAEGEERDAAERRPAAVDAHDVSDALSRVRNLDQRREGNLLSWISFYGGAEYTSPFALHYEVVAFAPEDCLSYNVIASVCDTVHAEVIQSRPRPMVLTTGGSWEEQERARKLNQWIDGLFVDIGVDTTSVATALDALVTGTGAIKVYAEHGQVRAERVLPGELWVDPREAAATQPRTLYQVKWYDRWVLAELYEDFDPEAPCRPPSGWEQPDDSDLVLVIEAWHLASGPDADDGRHVIVCGDELLLDEPWEDPGFPFAFIRWKPPIFGFWGQGIPEALAPLQVEVNRLVRDKQAAQYLMGSPKYFVPRGARISANFLTNEPGAVIEFDGQTPPSVWAGAAVPRDMYEQEDRHYRRAFELIGVSQMAAQSLKPAGIDSGVALRYYLDNQSKRFLWFARQWETFHVDLAKLAIRAMRALAKDHRDVEVVHRDGSLATRIAWADCSLDEPSYTVHVFPVSALASSPMGRLQQLQELFSAGMIDRDMFLEMSNLPDLEAQRRLLTAPRELIEQRLGKMLAEGDYYAPTSFMNFDLAILLAGLTYQRAELQGVPQERLDLLARFIDDAVGLKEQMQIEQAAAAARLQAAAQPAAPGPAGPPDAGAPPVPASPQLPPEAAAMAAA